MNKRVARAHFPAISKDGARLSTGRDNRRRYWLDVKRHMSDLNCPPCGPPPGFASRRAAADVLEAVLRRNRPLDEQLDGKSAYAGLKELSERDRALARRI